MYLEQLEERRLLAAITWINTAGGDWNVPGNWSLNQVPAATDDVLIPDLGSAGNDLVIAVNSGAQVAKSISTAETLRIASGSLTNLGNLGGAGSLVIIGGTFVFAGTNWSNTSAIELVSGSLNLGGSFTQSDYGSVHRIGGAVNLVGALNGDLTLNGSTGSWNMLDGGSINSGSLTTLDGTSATINAPAGATFDDVTINGVVNYSGGFSKLQIIRNLVLNGTINVGALSNELQFFGANAGDHQHITGTGSIVMYGHTGGLNSASLNQVGAPHTVTIESGITVRAAGAVNYVGGPGTWTNHGSFIADGASKGLYVVPSGTFTNEADGTFSASNGGYINFGGTANELYAAGAWFNRGSVTVSDATLVINGANNSNNTGTITASNATVNLNRNNNQVGLGTLNRSGGTVNITGTWTGGLTLDATTGPWYLRTGTIAGGIISTDTTNRLIADGFDFSYFTNGVVIANGSVVDMTGANSLSTSKPSSRVIVTGGLTIDGQLLLGGGDFGTLILNETQSVSGTGEVVFGQNGSFITHVQGPIAFTFGAGLLIRGKSGGFGGEGSSASNPTYILNGPVQVESGGVGIQVDRFVGNLFTNGTIDVANNSVFSVSAKNRWDHTGTLTSGTSSTLNLSNLVNTGTITANGSIINLAGAVTQFNVGSASPIVGQGTFNRTGGTVNLTGTLTGGLALDASTGPWYLYGGAINGGTITTQGSNTVRAAGFNGPGSYLDGVTIAAGSVFDMAEQSSRVTVYGGMTIDGTLSIGDAAGATDSELLLEFFTQTIGGTGSIVFGGSADNTIFATSTSGSVMTFGPNLQIRGRSGTFQGHSNIYVMNGPIRIDLAGQIGFHSSVNRVETNGFIDVPAGSVFNVESSQWEHRGVLNTAIGGVLNAKNLHNTGTITTNNATVNLLGESLTQANLGNIHRTDGTVNLYGRLTGGLTLNSVTGPWYLRGGTIDGGTIQTDANNTLRVATFAGGSSLRGATIAAGSVLDLAEQSSLVTIRNGLTVNGTILIGNSQGTTESRIYHDDSQSILGDGTIVFGAHSNNSFYTEVPSPFTRTITFGPDLDIRGKSVTFLGDARSTYILNGQISLDPNAQINAKNPLGRFVINGTIDIPANSTMVVSSARWANQGTINVSGGTLLATTSQLENLDAGILTGGTWNVSSGGVLRFPSSFTTNRATIHLDGSNSRLYRGDTGVSDALLLLSRNDPSGTITLTQGASLKLINEFTNSGTILLGSGSSISAPSPAVSKYQAEGNTADSLGSNHGSAPNGVSYTAGVAGQAFQFDGVNQSIAIPDSPANRPTSFTTGGWFNFASKSGVVALISKPLAGFHDSFQIYYNAGTIYGFISDGNSFYQIAAADRSSVDEWHHYALTFDDLANRLELYIDGQIAAVGDTLLSLGFSNQPLLIGADIENGSPNYYLHGEADEVTIYHRAMTADEMRGIIRSDLGASASSPINGLTSYYDAEGNARDSVGVNNGITLNGASYGPGISGQAFSLNGSSQWVEVPDSPSLRPENLTVSTWFKFTERSSLASIFDKPIGNSFLDSFTIWDTGGNLNAGIAVGNPSNPSFEFTSTGSAMDLGVWHHVAMTFDDTSNRLSLYLDGSLRSTLTVNQSIAYDSRPFILGAGIENGNFAYYFPGLIDETLIYHRALNADEIRGIYYEQIPSPRNRFVQAGGSTTLVDGGTLRFDEGVSITGGTLSGAGDIYANVVNASGTLAPGSSLGILDIHGDYTQSVMARTEIQIGGTMAGISYDQLNISGIANLDGPLNITLANGFGPSIGQSFRPITFVSRNGVYSNVSIPTYNASPFFTSTLGSTDLQLQAIVQSPNLSLDPFSIPSSKKFGDSFSINYSATNPSGQVAYSSWTDSVYLSTDQSLDSNDTFLGQRTQTAEVLAGANYAGTITATVPGIVGGRYYLIVSANTPFALPETSRADNARSSVNTMAISLDENPIIFNQQLIGHIESPYAVDRWTFTGGAGQSVSLSQVSLQYPNAIQFKLIGPNGASLFSGLTSDSDTVFLPLTGDYVLEVTSRNGGQGNYSFRLDQASPTPLTLNAPYTGSFSGSDLTQAFKASLTQAGPIRIVLDGAINTDEISIFSRLGALPTRRVNDQHGDTIGADYVLEVPLAAPGDLFIVLISDRVNAPSNFTLEVQTIPVSVTKVTPDSYETGTANARMIIEGLGFLPGSQVYLIPAAGPAIAAQSVSIDRSTQITATMNLAAVPVGNYGVRVVLPGGAGVTLASSFHVQNVGAGSLVTNLSVPSVLGRHQPATLYLTYANEGTAAITAPLLQVFSQDPDGSDKPLFTLDKKLQGPGLWTSAVPDGFANDVSVYASGAIPGLLLPGESFAVPIYWSGLQQPWDFADDAIEMGINIIDESDTRSIDYLVDIPKPDWITADAWLPVRDNLQQQIGNTWGDYIRMLSRNASYLHRFGQDVKDVGELYRFEVEKANGLSAFGTLSSAVDGVVTAAGLPISIGRSYGNSIVSRHKVGLFGRGWDAPAQAYLEVQPDGTLVVHESNEGLRRFQPDTRRAGNYFSPVGDLAVMKKIGNEYEVTETSGYKSRYGVDGKLKYEQDINGNRVAYGYTGSQLTSMTSANGESINIAYNAAGRISSVTESTGRTTTYNYDPTNSLLQSATGPSGTTSYTYSIGNGAAREFALTSETAPDGKTVHYEYNPRGELTASYLGANLLRVDLAYDGLGQVTSTDLAGVASRAFFDHQGLLVRSEDALGHYVVYEYNELRQLIKTTDDLGRTTSYTRCDCGRPKTITDVYGRTILTFELGGPNNQPLSFKDANNNVTKYTYDTVGNVTSTTYPDGTVERATYDAKGNLDTTTNRRGQIVDRTSNAQGQVTHEAWSDGTVRDYVYDSRGRLRTATDSLKGTTTLTYDTADRLTRIDYPGGRWITYTYDVAGRRTQIADNSGFATNYSYTTAGQLEYLRDASNSMLVHYSYDAAGRLSREDKGNGTYTVYGYDAAGRETSIFNYAPNGSVNSKFIYTYDAAGRRDTQTTIDGVWTYSYDLIDQLTRAAFVSSNPLIANQDLNYEYDALGNRIRTILNGVTTEYVSNNMNQYTTAGGTTFVYDTDGNLIREITTSGIRLYAYDQLNRLIHVETPDGIWDYEYDVLGNRTAAIENGVRTEYLVDPAGLGNIVGQYNDTGARTASYSHGLGLESMSAMTETTYYDFDAIGSTVGLSESVGHYVNRYAYNPWGESLLRDEATANEFEYVGMYGVMGASNGLVFMRERFYGPGLGRFFSQDPIRLLGGDTNFYRYVGNDPSNVIDPRGLSGGAGGHDGGTGAIHTGELVFDTLRLCWGVASDIAGGHFVAAGSAAGMELVLIAFFVLPGFSDPPPEQPRPVCPDNQSSYPGTCRPVPVCIDKPDPDLPDPPEPDIPVCIEPNQSSQRQFRGGGEGEGGTCNPGPKPPSPRPFDPNEKLAATGFGPQKFIAPETEIPYRINFENLGPGSVPPPTTPATAPAQRVDVTDDLSSLLDWNSFYFTGFGWGDTVIDVPLGLTYFFSTVGMTYNGKFFNVEVEMNFDQDTGKLAVSYQSVDPTNQLPPEVLTGFLPPEDGTNRGKGFLTFNVKPKASLASGTELRNVANIRFDFLETIATNQIDPQNPAAGIDSNKEALNTIDAGLPTSSVTPLSPLTTELSFTVTWSGSDDANGSGISGYDVLVSDNGGLPTLFQTNATTTSALFTGLLGHTYAFTTVAIDNVGHRELLAAQPDTQITIVDVSMSSSSIAENLAAGSVLGNLQSQFFPQNTSVTFELVGGAGSTDNGQFEIVGSSVKTKAKFDYETKTSYSIRVRATNAAGQSIEKNFAIAVSDLPEVQVTTINSGAAQRSLVRDIHVTFDGLVDFADLNAVDETQRPFKVRKRGANGGLVTTTANVSSVAGKTIVRLTFSGAFTEDLGSLIDGNYDLVINSAKISRAGVLLDGDANGIAGGDSYFGRDTLDRVVAADNFFRLLGDADGDAVVSNADLAAFNNTYRARVGQAAFNALFDFDANGVVDNNDLRRMNAQYRKRITFI